MDINLNIKTTAGKIAGEMKKFYEAINKTTDATKKLDKEEEKRQKLAEKILKDTIKLNEQYKKGEIEYKKYTKGVQELNKAMGEAKIDTEAVTKSLEELHKGLKAGSVTAAQAAIEFKKLATACEANSSKAEKVHAAFHQVKAAASALVPDVTKLAALLGVTLTLSFDHLAEKGAEFGKTLSQIKQYAAATGGDFGKLTGTIDRLGATTNLSRQEAAKFVLSFQKNIQGAKLQSDALEKLGKTMSDAGLDFESITEHQNNLIAIQNEAPGAIEKLMSAYKNKEDIDNYVNTLINQYHVSQDAAMQFKILATAMREGNAAADAGPMSTLKDAMTKLKKAVDDLETAFAQTLAPALAWVAEKLADVMQWVAQTPAWVKWAAIITGVVATALVGLAGFLLAATVAAVNLMTSIEALGVAFGGTAAAGAPLTVSLGAITTGLGSMAAAAWSAAVAVGAALLPFLLIGAAIAGVVAIGVAIYDWYKTTTKAREEIEATEKALADAKKRLASKGISGFESEQQALEKMKKDYSELVKMTGKRDMDREAAIDKAEQELNRKMQEKYKKNLETGNFAEGSGVLNEQQGALAAIAGKEQERQKTQQQLTDDLIKQKKELKAIEEREGAIVQAEQARYENLLKYNNDIPEAYKANDAVLAALRKQLAAQNAILNTTEQQLKQDPKNEGAQLDRANALQAINKLEAEINQKNMERTHIYDEQKAALDSNIALAESELNLSKQLYLGLAPSLEAQQKALDMYNQKIMLVEKEIAAAKRLAAERPRDLQAQKNLRDLQTEKNNLQAKELEITKNLREGYLDAMGAFTNVEGAFSKIIVRKDAAFGEAMRQFKVEGGLRTGQMGAGSDVAMARRNAQTGMLEIAGEEKVKKVTEGYIKGQPGADELLAGAGVIQKARMERDLGMEDVSAAQAAGGGSKIGGIDAARRKAAGGAPTTETAPVPQIATRDMAPAGGDACSCIMQLNKDMAQRVMEGVNASKLVDMMSVTAGGKGKGAGFALTPEMQKLQDEIAKMTAENQGANYTKDRANRIDITQQQLNKQMQEAYTASVTGATPGAAAAAGFDKKGVPAGAIGGTHLETMPGQGPQKIPALDDVISKEYQDKLKAKGITPSITEDGSLKLEKKGDEVDDTPQGKYQKRVDDRRKENEEAQKSFTKYLQQNRAGGVGVTTQGGGGGLLAVHGAGKGPDGRMEAQGKAMGDARAANDKVQKKLQEQIDGTAGMSPENKKKFEAAQKEMDRLKGNMQRDQQRGDKDAYNFDKKSYDAQKAIVDQLKETNKHAQKTSEATQTSAKIADKNDREVQKAKTEGGGSMNMLNAAAIGMGPLNGASMFGMSGGGGPLGLDMGNSLAFQNWTAAPDAQPGSPASAIGAEGWGAPMARGGKIPGVGDSDNVPALLMPGERIIPKGIEKKYGDIFEAMTKNKFALGGVVGPSPAMARAGGGGGMPSININTRGESANKILKSVHSQLSTQLNKMMAPNGTTGRFFELSQS